MSPSRLILVTGATGAIGPRVVSELCAEGFRVRTLSMDRIPTNILPDRVQIRVGNINDVGAVRAAVEDVDAVIHMAALLHNPLAATEDEYERINVGGTANLVEAVAKADVKRILFISTIAVYGRSQGCVFTEGSIPKPDTPYARSKLAAEKAVLDAKGSKGQDIGVVLRLAAVYGSRVRGNYERLVKSLAARRFIPIGDGSNRRSLVYDRDLAYAARLAVEHPGATGKIFNVSDGELHTLGDVISAICQALGRNNPHIHLPARPARFAAGIVERLARRVGCKPPIARSMIDKYTEDVIVDSSRIRKELGFAPKYGLLAGWKEAVQEMKQVGNL
jgi:nucleoside-diphosphate-sugar epimerase